MPTGLYWQEFSQQFEEGDSSLLLGIVRPNMEYCVQFWAPWYMNETGILEQVY